VAKYMAQRLATPKEIRFNWSTKSLYEVLVLGFYRGWHLKYFSFVRLLIKLFDMFVKARD
jgi:hypothetical protein